MDTISFDMKLRIPRKAKHIIALGIPCDAIGILFREFQCFCLEIVHFTRFQLIDYSQCIPSTATNECDIDHFSITNVRGAYIDANDRVSLLDERYWEWICEKDLKHSAIFESD